jgi:hypothetical protein
VIRPAQLILLEPESELIPRKPFGFMPFRFKHDFWKQRYIIEIWRGKAYIRISGGDSSQLIDMAIAEWKRFGKIDATR